LVRFLFTTLAGSGHFHPLVPPAQALRSRGHDVRFAAAPSFHPSIAAAQFPAFSAGFDRERDGADERFVRLQAELEELTQEGPARTLFRINRLFAGLYAERMVPDLLAITTDWRPDVIVREVAEFGGYIAAEAAGIPHASVRSNTMLSSDAARQLVAEPLAPLRAMFKLAVDPESATLFRYLHLAYEAPRFHDPERPLPPTAHLLNPIPFSQSGKEELPAWLSELPDLPTIYGTLGTVFNSRTPGLFEAILDGLRDEPVNLIVTVGRDRDPNDFGPQPANVRIERYIPQGLLLPYCDLVITHAGYSTVTAALSCGLPMVAIPIDADQPLNAQRCAALGVARVIEYRQRTPEAIRHSVQTILGDPSYRRNAERVRDEMAALPGPEHAVALLERLAREKQPILAG
jgi:UDP:flavonoid glycosyltransferase YjiC (YdhE family)